MIALTGASGFVGGHIFKKLKKKNKIRLILRTNCQKFENYQDIKVVGNFNKKTNWKNSLKGIKTLIHCAGIAHDIKNLNKANSYIETNYEGTISLAKDAIKNGIKKFIFFSTIKVNGEKNFSNKPFFITDKVNPENKYALSKLKAEQALINLAKKKKFKLIIIRLPLVYGENVKGNFLELLKLIKNKTLLPFGNLNNKKSYIYVENLVDFTTKIISKKKINSNIFFISDDYDLSTSELITLLSKFYGHSGNLYKFPIFCLKFIFVLIGKKNYFDKLNNKLQVDLTYTKKTINWKPKISAHQGLRKTVNFFKKNFTL